MNAGVGVRAIYVKNERYAPLSAELDYNIIGAADIMNIGFGPIPYISLSLMLGFDFRGLN